MRADYDNYVDASPQHQGPAWNATSSADRQGTASESQQLQQQLQQQQQQQAPAVDFLRLAQGVAQRGPGNATGVPSGGAPPLRELAMERYLRRFEGSAISTVLSPIMPFVPARIGSLRTFREVHRWFPTEDAAKVGAALGRLRRGTLGCCGSPPLCMTHLPCACMHPCMTVSSEQLAVPALTGVPAGAGDKQ